MASLLEQEPGILDEQLEYARKIAREKPLAEAVNELESSGLLFRQMRRVLDKYEQLGRFGPFPVNVLEAFTVLELFDDTTADHSIATLEIFDEKTGRTLSSGVDFRVLFRAEGIDRDEVRIAVLLHDLGKRAIPRFVIRHDLNDAQMSEVLLAHLQSESPDRNVLDQLGVSSEEAKEFDTAGLEARLSQRHVRPVQILPVATYLSDEQLDVIRTLGYDPNSATLAKIIELHEEKSEEFIRSLGHPDAAELAGKHHNYRNLQPVRPIALGTVGISVELADLLKIADVEQALMGNRPYKESLSKMAALSEIVRQSRSGHIGELPTYLWVQDEISCVTGAEELEMSENDRSSLEALQVFIAERQDALDPVIREYLSSSKHSVAEAA
jgi:hypothetical protein